MDNDRNIGRMEILHRACKKWIGLFLAAMLGLTILSRFLDTIIVPQVTVDIPKQGILQYQVKGSGTLEAEEVLNVPVLKEVNVRSVAAGQGQAVTAETPLFAYQIDELEELYAEKTRELQQLKLSLESERLSAEPLPKMSEEELARQELSKMEVRLGRAQEKLGKADLEYQEELASLEQEYAENLEKNKEDLTKERQRAYEKAENEYELARLNKRLDGKTADGEYDSAVQKLDQLEEEGASESELQAAESEVDRAYQNKDIVDQKWQFEVDMAKQEMDDAYDDWQALLNGTEDIETTLKKEYEKNVKAEKSALEAVEDELTDASDAYRDAQVALENARKNDSYAAKGTERTQDLSELEQQSMELDITAKEKEVEDIRTILAQDGVVYAPYTGILTKMDFSTDSGLVQIGCGGILMKAEVEEELAKNLTAESTVALKKEGRPLEVQAEFKSLEHDPDKDSARLTVTVANTTLPPGTLVEFVCESRSAPYYSTIPIDALRQDDRSTYILMVQERSTILGKELKAVRQDVTVIAKTTETAAIEGAVSSENRIIVDSTKNIEDGSRVRVVSQ